MPLDTVRVPAELEPLFERAQDYVRAYFADRRYDPTRGRVEIHGERYIEVRAASISIEFFDLVKRVYADHREAERVARSLLFDVAHALGRADARDFQAQMGVDDPLERLSAGPIHFAHAGWAFVDILPESEPHPDGNFHLVYDHPESFEADAWTASDRHAETPVCVMNAGYSSGWCSASFDQDLVSVELLCRGRGDDRCRFVMAPTDRISDRVEAYRRAHPELRIRGVLEVPGFFRQLREREEELQRVQRLEAIGRLAGGMAHDFNNLLTVILGCAEQLQEQVRDPEARKNSEAILQATLRASSLTRQLMAFTRKQVLDLEVLDLGELVLALRPLIHGVLREDIALELDLPSEPVCARADRAQLEQVLLNLVVNARQAMPTGGQLAIQVAKRGADRVVLAVEDDGKGMLPEVQRRATEPFFTTRADGTGLGLSVAAGVARQLNGSLEFEPVERGTRVALLLPLSTLPSEPPVATLPRERGEAGIALLVDDNEGILDVLSAWLQAQGWTVHPASSGEVAVALAQGMDRLDVVISDLVMPGMDGPRTAAAVLQTHPAARACS